MPALRARITPRGIPAPIWVTNTRKTPHIPTGQTLGNGAVGSHMARLDWGSTVVRASFDITQVGRRRSMAGARPRTPESLSNGLHEDAFAGDRKPPIGLHEGR